jgi:hypothetical protein
LVPGQFFPIPYFLLCRVFSHSLWNEAGNLFNCYFCSRENLATIYPFP